MKPIIKIEKLSKRYLIGGLHPGYMTFRELVADTIFAPFRALRGMANPTRQTLWAIKDFDLEVPQGELLGIIGHNGAGKSTLLKILSRVTKPTTGRVALFGRVGSLLEVGTGFHPDLTGRENIFLNGAILGMRRAEIERKFDEIVAFSEIEKFIETPVKWYSSGMYVRLAFSVAAHLEPEILIMDEVLTVGDAAFQQKCLEKMHEIRQQGRTILFVSHNMPAITRLCKRAILLDHGSIISDGSPQKVVHEYLSSVRSVGAEREWENPAEAPGNHVVRLRRGRVRNEAGEAIAAIDIRHSVGLEITYEVLEPGHEFTTIFDVHDDEGVHLFNTHDTMSEWRNRPKTRGLYTSTAWIPGNLLAEGNLLIDVTMMSERPPTTQYAQAKNAVAFQVVDNQQEGSARGDYVGPIPGVMRPLLNWTTEFSPGE